MLGRIFVAHGRFCSSHPWEVIVISLISTIYLLSTCSPASGLHNCNVPLHFNQHDGTPAKTEIILMYLARCMAFFCIYNQLKNLWRMQCNFILGVASIFLLCSGFIFCLTIIYLLGGVMSDLMKALPFFLLMADLTKVGTLTKIVLASSSSQQMVRNKMSLGMSELGPAITLDAIAGTLAIGIGALSGVKSLEDMSCFACLAVIVNFFVFVTFLPSCLSLSLELTSYGRISTEPNAHLLHDKEQKHNPALQRVKVIMSAGLVLVHVHCRWMLPENDAVLSAVGEELNVNDQSSSKDIEINDLDSYIHKWLNIGPDQLVFLGLTFALVIKYLFYENHDDFMLCVSRNLEESAKQRSLSRSDSQKSDAALNTSLQEKFHRTRSLSFIVSDKNNVINEIQTSSVGIQTESVTTAPPSLATEDEVFVENQSDRTLDECIAIFENGEFDRLTNDEVLQLVKAKHVQAYKLEGAIKDYNRGVAVRRRLIAENLESRDALNELPYENYDYSKVYGACCENVVGYMPMPVGIAGPMLLNDHNFHVPMATTEGCLVASVNRGFRALANSGGIRSSVVADGMSRAPVVRFPSAQQAANTMMWLQQQENFQILKSKFDSTSRFARLDKIHVRIAGRYLFIRFIAKTGDAMGMNMLSKGTEAALESLHLYFSDMEILSLSGNYCSDKKPAAVNWIEGRGKSVVCEAVVPENIVKTVLKTNVQSLIDVNISKNLIGSAIAGSIGGFNAQAANIVAAVFIATGQDAAQVVTSSNCMTLMEPAGPDGQDLYITVTMPSIEIGTVGGGTNLSAQGACLKVLNVQGSKVEDPGQNAVTLATVVCGAVLAGELSLISALSAGHLVRSHMQLNRKKAENLAKEKKDNL